MDLDPEPRERLRHFDADRAEPDHADPGRQVLLVEDRVGGQDPVTKALPWLGHDRAGAGCEDDLPGFDHAIAHNEPVRAIKARVTGDKAGAEIVGRPQNSRDEMITK